MNIIKITLLSLGLLWGNLAFAQTSTPFTWQRIILPTTPEAITMKNGVLYAHTKHETFRSTDSGDTWQFDGKHIDATLVKYNATDLVYLLPPIKWHGAYPSFHASWSAHVYGANIGIYGFSKFTTGSKGSTGEKLHLSDAQLLNDGTIIYSKEGIIFSNIMGSSSSNYTKKGILFLDGRPAYQDAPSNVFGHLDTFFLRINYNDTMVSPMLSFIGDTSFVSFIVKPIPFLGAVHIDTDSTIFILAENGKYAKSSDLGDTWLIDSIPFTGISSYNIRQSIHTFRINNTTVVSKDLISFHYLPQGYNHFVFKDLIISFQDEHTWMRSFDHGATWENFTPFGISTTKDNTMKVFDDTLYVLSENKLFKQTCVDRFDISPNNLFLLNSNQYDINSATNLPNPPSDCFGCSFKFFDAGDFYLSTGEYGAYNLYHKNYYRQKNDSIWHDISLNIPYWEPRYKSQFYYNVYSLSRVFSDIYYHPAHKSFYVSTSESGLNRTSVGMIAPSLVATKQLACNSPDTAYFQYLSCQPDTLFFSQPISFDTLLVENQCKPDTLEYQGVVYTSPGVYVIDTTKNQLGCDSIYHEIIINKKFITPHYSYIYDFLCLGDTLFLNDVPISHPGIYPYDTITSSLGCDSLYISLNLKGPIIDTIEIDAAVGDVIAGVEIVGDTIFTHTTWSSTYGCESIFNTYIISVPTGANETLSENIHIYPNPTNSALFVDHIPTQIREIYITDALGNRVYFDDTFGTDLRIDASSFPEGVYILNLIDRNEHLWHKSFTKIR